MSRHWWIPWQLRSAASRCSPQLFCQIVPVSGRNFSVTVPSHEVLLTQLYLACLSKEEKEYGQKRGLRERKWRNKSKSNWTGSSLSQRMPTNCKAALKKWEETTGRKCSEATEVQGDLFNWSSLLEFSTKMIKVANNEYFSMKLLGILSFCYWTGGGAPEIFSKFHKSKFTPAKAAKAKIRTCTQGPGERGGTKLVPIVSI